MVLFYFSGTGNSKAVAKSFAEKMNIPYYSIEEKIDFNQQIEQNKTIGFCYPVYGSRPPRIMREFVQSICKKLRGKKIIIFCTQYMFSGDGARSLMDLLPDRYVKVIYAEHFYMPNNISNVFFLPIADRKRARQRFLRTERKLDKAVKNIKRGVVKKRGFNHFSRLLGLTQGAYSYSLEERYLNSIKVNNSCSCCGLCASVCPMGNLEVLKNKVVQKANCTLCYRCINKCPKKAITIAGGKVKKQYRGI